MFVAHVAPAAVNSVAVASDCAAIGTVMRIVELFTVIGCRAETDKSTEIAALPVLLVMVPVFIVKAEGSLLHYHLLR